MDERINLYTQAEREAAITAIKRADSLIENFDLEIKALEDKVEEARVQRSIIRDQRAAAMTAYSISLWRTDRGCKEYQLK